MAHMGDFDASAVVYGKFSTYRPSTGATFTLAGTPALSVYKDNSTTQSTTGVTLTADFDSVTGLNHFAIDTSADGTFYAAGSFFDIVITTGTVDSVSVTGSVVGSFTIRKNSALKPTTAARTLDVSAGGEAGLDWANIGSPTTAVNLSGTNIAITEASFATTAGSFYPLGIVDQGTAQSATGTTLVLRSADAFADDELIGATIVITGGTTGVGQSRAITDYVSSTDTATVDTWTTTPTGTITYKIFATAAGSGTAPTVGQIATAVWQDTTSGDFTVASSIGKALYTGNFVPGAAGGHFIAGTNAATTITTALTTTFTGNLTGSVGSVTGAVGSVTGAVGSVTGSVGSVTGAVGSVTGAVGSVTGAVGSVTGNVGGNVTGSIGSLGAQAKLDVNAEADTAISDAALATAANLATVAGYVDTEVAAIKAKTDSLTFTVAGVLDANVQRINDVTITGNGQVGTEFGV